MDRPGPQHIEELFYSTYKALLNQRYGQIYFSLLTEGMILLEIGNKLDEFILSELSAVEGSQSNEGLCCQTIVVIQLRT